MAKIFWMISLAFSLNNSYKRVIWSIEIAKHFAQRDFVSSIINLNYKNSEIEEVIITASGGPFLNTSIKKFFFFSR